VSRSRRVFVVLSFGFVLLGMSITVPGVTWPSIAAAFDRSLAELGFVTLLFGAGYTAATLASGKLEARSGIGPSLLVAVLAATVALIGLSAAPTWWMFLGATALLGVGGGFTDAATNTYVAIRRGARSMGLIHAMFGVGAIAGPLLVAGLLQAGASWRFAYAALAAGQLIYGAGLWHFARGIDIPRTTSGGDPALRRSPVLFWSLAVFLVYTGVAAGTGLWAVTNRTAESGVWGAQSGLIVPHIGAASPHPASSSAQQQIDLLQK
jgi:MFS family permease